MLRLLRVVLLVLLGLFVVVWLRSYRFSEAIEVAWPHGSLFVSTHPGSLRASSPSLLCKNTDSFAVRTASVPRTPRLRGQENPCISELDSAMPPRLAHGTSIIAGRNIRSVEIPFRLLAIPGGLWMAWTLMRGSRILWKRRSGGFCRTCGYDLRATPMQCPECGTFVRRISWQRRMRLLLGFATAGTILLCGGRWLTRHDFHVTRYWDTDFTVLSGFIFKQDRGMLADIPLSIRQLNGQHIAIEGYMIPMDQAEKITEFALVSKLFGWGSPPLVQECIVVKMPVGKTLPYFPDRIRIVGTLHVLDTKDDGYVTNLFEMTLDNIEPASNKP